MRNDLAMSVALYNRFKEQLQRENQELSDDDQCLCDTLEGITDVEEQIAMLIRDAQRAAAMAKGLAEIKKDNEARKQRLEAKSTRLRTFALAAMQECGIKNIPAPDLTISISAGVPSVIITNDDCVPDALCTITRTPKKNEIAARLKSGEFIPYATLSNAPPVLKVCSK
jgi:ribosomal protein S15P/S13E